MALRSDEAGGLVIPQSTDYAGAMGVSTWRVGLERRYKDWRGEQERIRKDVAEIEAAYETLDEKKARLERLVELIGASEVIMSEVAPGWDPALVKPTQQHKWRTPFEPAAITRGALDLLRVAKEPQSAKQLATQIIIQHGLDTDDTDLMDRVRAAVDASMRAKERKGFVEKHGEWPVYWSVKHHGNRPGD
ncbi:MAG: hypothetical protein DI591_02345 [Citromicrobium sp.]|nr:MAG: hypothetical protein DI591_02345 [Citromicrobium sp.]